MDNTIVNRVKEVVLGQHRADAKLVNETLCELESAGASGATLQIDTSYTVRVTMPASAHEAKHDEN